MSRADTDIAIVGMAGRFPGARSIEAFWKNLRDGVESIQSYSDEELLQAGVDPALLAHPEYVKSGAPLADMEWFDAGFFGFNPREAAILDPQHRHFLECAWEALEHAGHPPGRFPGAIGVFAGSGHNAYLPYNLLTHPELVRSVGLFLLRHTGNDKDFLVTRLSYLLDLKGPSLNVQTACSTSLVAVHLACQSLLTGECDLALAGGVTIELPHRQGYRFQEGEILSPDGHCRPFDARSTGTVFGSGLGIVALRRLDEARQDGDTIHAVIKGTAVNNDGARKVGYLAPSVEGQAQAITEALAVGGVAARSISYVEAHGTGTPVGDPIEVAALTEAFRRETSDTGFCGIGSVKSNIGHLDTAAGVASLIKVVLALRHELIPPSLHFSAPNPECRFETSPFRVVSEPTPWPRANSPRRAGISSLGVGGTNAHVVVEESPPDPPPAPARDWQLLPVSARSPAAVDQAAANLAGFLRDNPGAPLADLAWTLQAGRAELGCRRVVVARTGSEAVAALEESRTAAPVSPGENRKAVNFMFAGGGAQYPGMGAELYRCEPAYRTALDRCLELLPDRAGDTLRSLLFPAPGREAEAARQLERPSWSLPALFATQVATAELLRSFGLRPAAMIGHSMGEYTAAHLAGVFSLEDALALVLLRGRLFETLAPGGMVSVHASEATLAPLVGSALSVAAVNGPELTLISGPVSEIEKLEQALDQRELDWVRIRINVAAHSSMLEPILPEFRRFLSRVRFQRPTLPFVSNVTGEWITEAQCTDPGYWVSHLRQPVRFALGLETLMADPDRHLLEVGPGRTLASLARQHPARGPGIAVATTMRHPDEAGSDLAFLLGGLGRLWQHGLALDWQALQGEGLRRRIPIPTYPWQRERFWIDPVAPREAAAQPERGEPDPRTLTRLADLDQWFFEPRWIEIAPPAAAVTPRRVLVFTDDLGIGAGLAERVRAAGGWAGTVAAGPGPKRVGADSWSIDPNAPEDYAAVLGEVIGQGGAPDCIVHLWACGSESDPTRSFYSLLYLAQALTLQDVETPMQLVAVSSSRYSIAGETTPVPEKSLLAGPIGVFPREHPGIAARQVDVLTAPAGSAEAGELIGRLWQEIADPAARENVVLRGPRRWTQEVVPAPREARSSRFRPGAHYLISGGLGGIGLVLARELTSRGARVTLLSRTPLPPPDQWPSFRGSDRTTRQIRAVSRIVAAGGDLEVLHGDVTKPENLRAAVEAARARFGPIAGVFHAAGVLHDGVMALKDPAEAARVLAPKVAGTSALVEATRADPLDFLVLFSSVSAIAGLPGQSDYAAANAFLDGSAAALRQRGIPAVAIAWTAWREVGMAAELARELGMAGPEAEDRQALVKPHPFLEQFALTEAGPAFFARLSPDRHWLLGEHRVSGGDPLLPGTGYLELARAGFERLARAESGPIELAEVGFSSPFAVPDGEERDLLLQFRDAGDSLEFQVLGRHSGAEWQEHGAGRIRRTNGTPPRPVDLAAIEARCGRVVPVGRASRSAHLDFGPRWHNIEQIAFGKGEALISLSLDSRFGSDLPDLPLHPALLDMATAGAQDIVPGLDLNSDFLVPLSYASLRIHRPLDARLMSHVRMTGPGNGDTVSFDVTVTDRSGAVLVEIEELTLIRVRERDRLGARSEEKPAHRGAALANPLLEINLRQGIGSREGIEALERILSGPLPERDEVSPLPPYRLLETLRRPAEPGPKPGADPAGRFSRIPDAEAALREHEAVEDAVVMALPDPEGQSHLVAWVAFRSGEQATASELRRWLREKVAEDQVVRTFVEMDRIPRPVDPERLPKPFAVEESGAELRTPTERILAELWQELLGVNRVGPHDNFFDIGGHSLLAVRFITRLHRKLNIRLKHEQVVIHTLGQLAAISDELAGAGVGS